MTTVTCSAGVDRLMDYMEGLLATDVRATLETHVGGCARCAAFVASYRETPRILRQATARTMPGEVRRALDEFLRALREG